MKKFIRFEVRYRCATRHGHSPLCGGASGSGPTLDAARRSAAALWRRTHGRRDPISCTAYRVLGDPSVPVHKQRATYEKLVPPALQQHVCGRDIGDPTGRGRPMKFPHPRRLRCGCCLDCLAACSFHVPRGEEPTRCAHVPKVGDRVLTRENAVGTVIEVMTGRGGAFTWAKVQWGEHGLVADYFRSNFEEGAWRVLPADLEEENEPSSEKETP